MNSIIRYFNEFKSIFVSKNVLRENEEHANIVTAITMHNMFWICVLTCILTHTKVFSISAEVADALLIRAVGLFLIPAIVCLVLKGKVKWLGIELDETERAWAVMLHLFIPKYLVYLVVAFACIQVSQSGKNILTLKKGLGI